METFQNKTRKALENSFKSYYVVWKLFPIFCAASRLIRLNRTM